MSMTTELIDRLKRFAKQFEYADTDTMEILNEAAETIKTLSGKVRNQGWIPVSERLPEKNVWVLVTVVQGSGWYVEIMRIDKYKGMFTDNIDYYDSVIAWMPLPEPYNAESEETE